jgi:hypothetical protein
MLLEDLEQKYGSDIDWEKVSDDDLYSFVDGQRETFSALYEEQLLSQHFIYPIVRRRCVTSLYFLSRFSWDSMPDGGIDKPISESRMTLEDHGRFLEIFVKKDPDKTVANQSKLKDGLILYPRGSLKSSWGYLDAVQWVLYDSAIRILILTAADDMAAATVDSIKSYFVIKEDFLSLMNYFWPEHSFLEKDSGRAGEFTTPDWSRRQVKRKEPTVMSRGITSTLSGFHFEVIIGDDAVSDRNSLTVEQCEVVKKRWGLTKKTRMAYGYCIFLGTRYNEADLYGNIINNAQLGEYKTEDYNICCSKTTNLEKGIVILIGAAMTVKPDCELDLVNKGIPRREWYRKAGRNGIELLMPNVPWMGYDTLLGQFEESSESFESQQRQNVLSAVDSAFTEELLKKATVSWTELPVFGRISQTWDFASSKGNCGNDNSVGTNCLWGPKGEGYINDLVRANFSAPLMLAKAIVEFASKHHPEILSIEDSPGARMLEPTIIAEADKYRHPRTGEPDEFVRGLVRRIHWRHVDNQKDAKEHRINSLQPLLMYGRLKFVNTLPYLKNLYEEFKRRITKGSKNDIPDAISFQKDFMPVMPSSFQEDEQTRVQREEEQKKQIQNERDKSAWQQMFEESHNIYYETPPQQQEYMIDEVFTTSTHEEGLDNILGAGLVG